MSNWARIKREKEIVIPVSGLRKLPEKGRDSRSAARSAVTIVWHELYFWVILTEGAIGVITISNNSCITTNKVHCKPKPKETSLTIDTAKLQA